MRKRPFLPGFEPPQKVRLKRMRATDIGQAPGMMPGWKTAKGAHFECPHCGHVAGWKFDLTDTEVRQGLPCPKCNEGAK